MKASLPGGSEEAGLSPHGLPDSPRTAPPLLAVGASAAASATGAARGGGASGSNRPAGCERRIRESARRASQAGSGAGGLRRAWGTRTPVMAGGHGDQQAWVQGNGSKTGLAARLRAGGGRGGGSPTKDSKRSSCATAASGAPCERGAPARDAPSARTLMTACGLA